MDFENRFRNDEVLRIRAIRVLSIVIGVILARVASVDSAPLIGKAFPELALTLQGTSIPVLDALRITPGILLTGLAASAGSAFWHDVLDRLRAGKNQLEIAAAVARKATESNTTS